jgi:protein TonB
MAGLLRTGILGIAQRTLSPSLVAIGPNRYLREKDFLTMLGVAFAAHIVVVVIASLLPGEKVTDIPVRALSFKIGGQDRIAALGIPRPAAAVPEPAPAEPAPSPQAWRASAAPLRPTITPAMPKVIPVMPVKPVKILPDLPRTVPMENLPAPAPTVIAPAAPAPQPAPAPKPALPSTDILTQVASPAIAVEPQRFVRETGAAPAGAANGLRGGTAAETTLVNGTTEQVRERYEQQISAWIQQHKLYPAEAGGREGKVIVRMRIDRSGYVRYFAVEQSSGIDALDAAAVDMVRRANPVPAVPANYPAGNLIEFLIPISYRAPR